MTETSGVVITSKDMYIELVQLREQVNRLIPPAEQLADHEKRLRKLERWLWSLPAGILVSGGAVAVAYLQSRK